MPMETLVINDSSSELMQNQLSKGVFIPKSRLIIGILLTLAAFAAVVLGLVFGLNKQTTQPEEQKLVWGDIVCSNSTYFSQLLNQCPTTTMASTAITTAQITETQPPLTKNYRLPTNLKPYYYDILMEVKFSVFDEPQTFDGKIDIHVECANSTNQIVLHVKDMIIKNDASFIRGLNDTTFKFEKLSWTYDNDTDFLEVTLPEQLRANQNYVIHIEYTGYLKNDNKGFYKSSYTDNDGKTRWLLASQMQPTDARKSFPCFDEPAMKAQFKMNVIHHNTLKAMSNMPNMPPKEINQNFTQTEFETTVKMSTYLVALLVSDFKCKENRNTGISGNVITRVCARENAQDQLDYALDIASKQLKYFEELYAIPYTLTKCDHIALPDFQAGAMENWGLVTYRESILFYNNKTSSDSSRQFTVAIIAHELAHMWFGNIVSPQWWNDLWLSEGFATYMEYVGTEAVEKEFKIFDQHVISLMDTLRIDSLPTSHAISVEVNKPDEINEIFDAITYSKGGLLIRMMNYFLSRDTFEKGVTEYLKKYQFSNAKQDYLWEELETQAKKDNKLRNDISIRDVMNTWTKQMGYPLISVERSNDGSIILSQKHFLLNQSAVPQEPSIYNYKWNVPFTYSVETFDSQKEPSEYDMNSLYNKTEWILQSQNEKKLDGVQLTDTQYLLANLDASGFYRVNYDTKSWDLLTKQLTKNKDAIPVKNRGIIIDDAFALAEAGYIETFKPFEIINYLSTETELLPWIAAISQLSGYITILDTTNVYDKFNKYLIKLIEPIYKKLTWDQSADDSWLDRKLRTSIISYACARGLDDCVNKSLQFYSDWQSSPNNNNIPPGYRSIVYCTAIRNGPDSNWHFASEQYDKEQSAVQRNYLQVGMSCTKQPWLLSQYLNDQLNTSKVRTQDTISGLSYAAARSYGSLKTWNFIKNNWNKLFTNFGGSLSFGRLVSSVASKFNTIAQLEDFESFFKKNPNQGSAAREVKSSTEIIKQNINWIAQHLEEFEDWLTKNQGESESKSSQSGYRLPTNIQPYYYDIHVDTQFTKTSENGQSFPFNGAVRIDFECFNDTNDIVFHINHLDIDNSSLKIIGVSDENFGSLEAFNWYNDFERQFFIANLTKTFKANHKYSISMKYTGYLKDDNAGFYRSSYIDNAGNRKWLLASQMQPTDARKSFPCFDEPAMKAKFKISVVHPANLEATSNMPVERINSGEDGKTQTTFKESVVMPTYLVGLLVSDFQCKRTVIDAGINRNVNMSVCARPNAFDQVDFAFDAGIEILKFFEGYYNIKYQLPKVDHIALPDFSAGAMENWGIITYREGRLLYRDGITPENVAQGIIQVIAHELAHMWFGNLVSPQWWDDLWLNEGFARYMEYVGTNAYLPEWEMYEQFVYLMFNIMQLDAVSSSHPISVDVNKPDEIFEIFDDITYGKGASVVRMANYILGTDTFLRGLTNYLNKYEYSNANQNQLWHELAEQMKLDNKKLDANLTDVMTRWTRQMGHPLIRLRKVNSNTIAISQKHFLLSKLSTPVESPYDYKWYVPFTYQVQKLNEEKPSENWNMSNLYDKVIWLKPEETEKTITLSKPLDDNDFIYANLDAFGFYRVNYDDENWDKFAKQLSTNRDAIPVRNRAQIINDAFVLSQVGDLNIEKPFEIINYIPQETEYLPWITTITRLGYYTGMLEMKDIYGDFENYLLRLIQPIYDKLTWEPKDNDKWLESKLRTNIIRMACSLGMQDCVDKASDAFRLWFQQGNENQIPANYRSIIYCLAVKNGGKAEWEFLAEKYQNEKDSAHKNDIQSGMACAKEPWLIKRFLDYQLDQSKVRVQDTLSGLRAAALRPEANEYTWDFVKQNWNELFKRYGNSLGFARLIADVSSKFNTQSQLEDFENFFNENKNQGSATREVQISLDKIKANIMWMNENYEQISNWIRKNTPILERVTDVRLPRNLKPISYHLTLKPYIGDKSLFGDKAFKFDGQLRMFFRCEIPTDQIIFHLKNIEIHNDTLKLSSTNDPELQIKKEWTNDYAREFFKGSFTSFCKQGVDYELYLEYEGVISDKLSGFYKSSYFDPNLNQTVYLATTHFQPTDARKALPCFDEPDMKAKIKLTIIRHKTMIASFGNMEHISFNRSTNDPDWFEDRFNESVEMSTYLFAFVVSNFKKIIGLSPENNILCEVAAKPQSIDDGEGDFALKDTMHVIDFFAKYFNIPYALKKSTQIAVPDFNAGAMENYGLVIYRENALLVHPRTGSLANKRRVALVISHELAHQWFGNLVTPEWWNDLWLNEGFATYAEYLGLNFQHPEWRDRESFSVQVIPSFVKDSLEASHPISVEVKNPNEINSLFDAISYDKGASVIGMMNAFLTEQTFKTGVTNYLNKYAYSNAKQDDLWEQLTLQAYNDNTLDRSLTVKDVMDTWTLQKGYPVVTLTRVGDKQFQLTQKWFLLNSLNKLPKAIYDKQKWFVPFTYTTAKEPSFRLEANVTWLKPTDKSIQFEIDADSTQWVIGNLLHSGFYRVNYDQDNWNLLKKQLSEDFNKINPINRAQILDDAFNLGRANIIGATIFLDTVAYLTNDEDPIPWIAAFHGFRYTGDMLETLNDFDFSVYKNFVTKLLQKNYDRLAWNSSIDNENAMLVDLQVPIMSLMCDYDNRECVQKARQIFNEWKQDENNKPITPNFKTVVFNTVIRNDNVNDEQNNWDFLFNKAKNTISSAERVLIFRALAQTRDCRKLAFLLSQTGNTNVVKSQDETSVIAAVSANPLGRSLAWEHFVKNWNGLLNRYGEVSFTLAALVTNILSKFNTQYDLEKVEDFIRKNPYLGVAKAAFFEAIETIKINTNWIENHSAAVRQWLQKPQF